MGRAGNATVEAWAAGSLAVLLMVAACAACRGGRSGEQALDQLRAALPEEASGWRAADDGVIYDSESIYSYIDGHAEVYLAYGMHRCLARRYAGPSGEADVVVDAFELPSPADAYGVFSHGRDGDPAPLGSDGVMTAGWLSFWKGRFAVSVYAEQDSAAARAVVLELGRALDGAIVERGARPVVVEALPSLGLEESSVRFLRSHQILNSQLYLSDDNLLELGPETGGALGRYHRAEGSGLLLIVDYPDADRRVAAARGFADRFLGGDPAGGPRRTEDGTWYGVGGAGNRLAAVLAASDEQLVVALLDDVTQEESR